MKVLIVGEAYGAEEDKVQQPFVGRSGKYLKSILPEGNDYLFTNVCNFRPMSGGIARTPSSTEITRGRQELNRTIAEHRPNLIVGLGSVALEGLTGKAGKLEKVRGRVFNLGDLGYMAFTFHPSYARRFNKTSIFESDIREILACTKGHTQIDTAVSF